MELPKQDRHHIFHDRAWYLVGTPEYRLRTHHLMIPTMTYESHHYQFENSLHRNVEQPQMPTPDLALFAIGYLATLGGKLGHLEAISALATQLDRRSLLGGEIAENLGRQLIYIEAGYAGKQ